MLTADNALRQILSDSQLDSPAHRQRAPSSSKSGLSRKTCRSTANALAGRHLAEVHGAASRYAADRHGRAEGTDRGAGRHHACARSCATCRASRCRPVRAAAVCPETPSRIRGFSATNDIFVDGVRDVGPYSRDAFNLEQVEVIKGPSSAFGGRGSTGGAINLVTKSAGLESIRQGTVGIGNAGYQRTTVDLNAPVKALGRRWRAPVECHVAGRRRPGS